MKNASRSNKPGHITKGNIFDDLGFSPAETLEAKIKAEIWQALMKHIEQHGYSQAYLVAVLKVHQPDVSNFDLHRAAGRGAALAAPGQQQTQRENQDHEPAGSADRLPVSAARRNMHAHMDHPSRRPLTCPGRTPTG